MADTERTTISAREPPPRPPREEEEESQTDEPLIAPDRYDAIVVSTGLPEVLIAR
jgi:hypothetical protein